MAQFPEAQDEVKIFGLQFVEHRKCIEVNILTIAKLEPIDCLKK